MSDPQLLKLFFLGSVLGVRYSLLAVYKKGVASTCKPAVRWCACSHKTIIYKCIDLYRFYNLCDDYSVFVLGYNI
jgi:hypothetical protein